MLVGKQSQMNATHALLLLAALAVIAYHSRDRAPAPAGMGRKAEQRGKSVGTAPTERNVPATTGRPLPPPIVSKEQRDAAVHSPPPDHSSWSWECDPSVHDHCVNTKVYYSALS